MVSPQNSANWFKRHVKDEFVKLSKKEGVRSRSAFKLDQIMCRFPVLIDSLRTINACAIDLGASPGGWSQILTKYSNPTTKILAVDVLPLKPLNNIKIFNLDFTLESTKSIIIEELKKEKCSTNLIVSDMCANLTGTKFVDIYRNLELWTEALNFSVKILQCNGNLVLKMFESPESNEFVSKARHFFRDVAVFKPKASRLESSEKYLICMNKK